MDYSREDVEALVECMWQLLDDMGKDGKSVCLLAKAEARLALQPFLGKENDPADCDLMDLELAKSVVAEVD